MKYSIGSKLPRSTRSCTESCIRPNWDCRLADSEASLIRWLGASLWVRIVYFRRLVLSLILGGYRAASTSIGIIGLVLKTPNIFLRPRF